MSKREVSLCKKSIIAIRPIVQYRIINLGRVKNCSYYYAARSNPTLPKHLEITYLFLSIGHFGRNIFNAVKSLLYDSWCDSE